jgi:hypothetical protein
LFASGEGQQVELMVDIGDDRQMRVAIARVTHQVHDAGHRIPAGPDAILGPQYLHRRRSWARVIANLRGREAERTMPLFHDPYSRRASGAQGERMAQHLTHLLPSLQPLIADRTRHCDETLEAALARGVRQVITVGVGRFMAVMARVGEPFRSGHSDPSELFRPMGLSAETVDRSDAYTEMSDPIFDSYRFAVLAPTHT